MDSLVQDLRHGWRQLARSPLFTLVAVTSLAVGLCAVTTVFTLANALFLRPLPVAAPSELVTVHAVTADGTSFHAFSHPTYVDLRERATGFAGLAAYADRLVSLGASDGEPEPLQGQLVSANYFSVLGLAPAHGRFFLPEEEVAGAAPVAVLSHALWQRRFGSDPGVVGRTVRINGQPFTVVGVGPRGFTGNMLGVAREVWVPLGAQPLLSPERRILDVRTSVWLESFGRLRQGTSRAQAQSELSVLARQLAEAHPGTGTVSVEVAAFSGLEPRMRGGVLGFLAVLMTAAGLVLLIACTNVAGMLLTRAVQRQREVAVRLALGAGRWRLVRQLLTESLLLFGLAGLAGLLLTTWASDLLLSVELPIPARLGLDLGLDARVLGFSLAVALGTGGVAGLAPALQGTRTDLLPALKGEGAGRPRSRLRDAFVVGQVALSLLLLIGAGLFLRALWHAEKLHPGFTPAGVEAASLNVGLGGYDEARGRAFYGELLARLEALPEVESVGLISHMHLDLGNRTRTVTVAGHTPPPGEDGFAVDSTEVSPRALESLRIPLLRGRDFRASDGPGAPSVIIINEAFARRFWPGEDPIGKRVGVGQDVLEVVGVARDAMYRTFGEAPRPFLYVPFLQSYQPKMTVLVRVRGEPEQVAGALRESIRALDEDLAPMMLVPLRRFIGMALLPQRLAATVAGGLGLVGLLLACLGIYGVVSYAVSQRTREFGIRAALGAPPAAVRGMVLRQGLFLALLGVALGTGMGLLVTRALAGFLYGISPTDPLTFGGLGLLLLLVALLASYLPARKASRVDPLVALRYD